MSTHWIRRMGGVKRNPSTTADGLRVAPPILLALAISVFAGCANISSKNEPPSDVQAAWEGAPEGVALELAESTSAWWLGFNDPILNELMKTAETRNLDLRIEEARIREARALRQAAGANFRPDVSVFAEGVRQRPGGASASPFNTFELGLDASWELDVFGRVRNQARAAEADVQAAQADRDGVRVALLAEVARTYIEYRLYQAQTDIAQRTASAEEGTVRITRARFEKGMSNRMELERTVSALAVTRAQIPQARTLTDSARYRLAYLVASTPEALSVALSGEKPMPDSDPLRVLLAPTDVLALRPDVRAAQQRLVSAGQLREAAAALRY
ncbi:MAG TPA: TolC family protein, partial [Burkholderiales bacterium]|nr:TolC family protein [Burkholderiales bacterium]